MADPDREGAQSSRRRLRSCGGRVQLGSSRSPESPASPGAARGWLSPAGARGRGRVLRSAMPCAPSRSFPGPAACPPGRADRPQRCGVLQGVRSAFRALPGSLCKPSGVGRTARGAAGPGSPGAQVLAPGFSTPAAGDQAGAPGGRRCVCVFVG